MLCTLHTQLIKQIKIFAKEIPCLHLPIPEAQKIVETDASNIDYGGILKQKINNKEQLIQYTSGTWNNAQRNYATVKKENLAIVLCIQKFHFHFTSSYHSLLINLLWLRTIYMRTASRQCGSFSI
ncbi:hypothetical protein CFOL_v3_25925 [Cephalotus follicularis]|uniref:Reverse transcriptase/retrotransposon-derived protein RNase H-like domain-containing protein n=1 Tax=Cephalotus follicularis TaxID=3775 RepID=A0A1Q3CQE3_CEPFO|nr:hypothetical protein CFOL_v3_25925 [Cephalotus follicularis]